jgi:transketolase
LQSDTYVCDVNDLGDIEAKFSSFGWHCQRADGHEIEQIRCAISNAKSEIETPSVIIFDTTKGQGVSFMEPNNISFGNLYPFHSGAPSDKDYYRALEEISIKINEQMAELDLKPHSFIAINRASPSRPAGAEKLLPAYTKALMEAMRENDNIVVLDADLRLDTGLVEVHQAFPDRFIECGIAEQDMVSTAGTLALMGKIPIVHSFACFLSSRPNEQIYNNATEGSKIIYFGALAGLLPGGPGHSHQAVRDISSLGNIPGISVVEAADGRQLQKLFHWAVETNLTSTYIRAVTLPFEQHYPLQNFKVTPGHGRLLRHGGDMTLISYGPLMLNQTILASQTLATEGIEATVIDMPWLNMVDPKWLQNAVIPGKPLFVIENHYTAGGLGQTIATNILAMKNSLVSRQIIFGLNEVPACGGNDQVMKFHQLDAASISMRVKQNLI